MTSINDDEVKKNARTIGAVKVAMNMDYRQWLTGMVACGLLSQYGKFGQEQTSQIVIFTDMILEQMAWKELEKVG